MYVCVHIYIYIYVYTHSCDYYYYCYYYTQVVALGGATEVTVWSNFFEADKLITH